MKKLFAVAFLALSFTFAASAARDATAAGAPDAKHVEKSEVKAFGCSIKRG